MDIPQNKLKGFFNLLPKRPAILTLVHKNGAGRSFEHTTLDLRKKRVFSHQKDIPIGGMYPALCPLRQQSPAQQNIFRDIFHSVFLGLRLTVPKSDLFHSLAQVLDFFLCYCQILADHIVIRTALILIVHFRG